jgi:hypothetical protein
MFRLWERWGAGLGVVGVALWVVAFAFGSSSPDTEDGDSTITSWYASSSHQNSQIIAFFVFVAGVLCVIGFYGALRERLADAEPTPARIGQLAFGAGLLSAAFEVIAIIAFVAPAFVASDTGSTDVLPSTFRILNDMGYSAWVVATMIGAIAVWATSAVVLRSRALPRWFGWLGVVVGLVQLFAIFFIPILVYWAWIALASILFVIRGASPATEVRPA